MNPDNNNDQLERIQPIPEVLTPKVDDSIDPDPREAPVEAEQTRFAEESAFFVNDVPGSKEPKEEKPANPRRKLLIGLGIGVPIIFLLFLVMVISSLRQSPNYQRVLSNNVASSSAQINDELAKRLYQADQEITKADPSQTELAFPPVSFELDLKDASLLPKSNFTR